MSQVKWKTVLAGVALVAAVWAVEPAEAEAGWWSHGSGGSHGSWGSSGGGHRRHHRWFRRGHHSSGGSYGSWGSSGGSYGSYGSWGSSGGSSGGYYAVSYGSWGSSGGSSGGYSYPMYSSWGSSGGSSGGYSYPVYSSGHYGSGYTVVDDGAAAPSGVAPGRRTPPPPPTAGDAGRRGANDQPQLDRGFQNDGGFQDDRLGVPSDDPLNQPPAEPGLPGGSTFRAPGRDAGLLTVQVPVDARVFVNGKQTRSTGELRQFLSRGLQAGQRYAYDVRVELDQNGRVASRSKTVYLTAGQSSDLEFSFDAEETVAAKPAVTTVRLHVPADAKVYLAGREMKASGPVREFSTSRIAAGDRWEDYSIRVVANVGGREVSKTETISLTAGETRDLTIDLGDDVTRTAAR